MEQQFEKEILERLIRIETKLDDYDSIKTKVEEARAKSYSNERRINEIEDKLKWISRLTIGAVITGIITLMFAFFKLALKI